MVQHSGEIPEGQAAIGGCAAQKESPGSQERAAESGRWRATGAPIDPHRPFMQPLSPPLVGCLMREGVDLEDTPLVVEGFSQELQPPPRVLQKKEPHCPITTGCSHKGAKVRLVKLTHS